jgi:hypothetical protein
LIDNNLDITNSYKSAEQSAQSFNEVLQNQARLAAKATQALNARLGVTGPKATDQGAGFGAIEQEIEQLATKYNKVYAASNLYETQLNEINRAHQLGVVSIKQHEDALERLNMEYQAFQNGTAGPMNRFEQNLQQTAGGLNNFGVVTQQVGYQVGDFLVQVQSGTNWMVAFGQQATQLVGFLPMLSGSLGVSAAALVGISAGLGIAIPLVTAIGAAWMRSSEQVKKSASEQEESIKSLDNTLKEYLNTQREAATGFTTNQIVSQEALVKAQEDLADATERLAEIQAVANVQSTAYAGNTGAALANTIQTIFAANDITSAIEAQAQAQERVSNLRNLMLQSYEDESRSLATNLQLEEAKLRSGEESLRYKQLVAEADRRSYEDGLKGLGLSQGYVIALMNQYDAAVKVRQEAEKAKEVAEQFKTTVSGILGTMTSISQVDLKKPFASAIGAAQALLNVVKNIADVEGAAVGSGPASNTINGLGNFNLPTGLVPPALGGLAPTSSGRPQSRPNDIDFGYNLGSSGGSSGGGANSDDRIQNELEALYKYLDMVKETETSAYAERQETLKEALDSKIITLTEYQELEKALVEQHNSDLAMIESKQQDKRLGEVGKFFGSMASLAQAGGQKYVKIAKVLGATEALINTYVAQSQVLRDPTLGFFGKMAAYASIGAAGLGLVSALQGGGVGGKSGSGGRAGGRGTTKTTKATPAVTPQTVYISGIQPDALFTGEMLSNLFDNFYDENDNRGKVFVVNK